MVFFCESCQLNIEGDQVRLEDDSMLPICRSCWDGLAVSVRIKLANDFRHQSRMGATLDELRKLIVKSLGDSDEFSWLTGRN